MAQPTKKGIVTKPTKKKKVVKKTFGKTKRKHQEYGTSKLEEKFAKEFLDKMGYQYIYQYKAESIGRYFDFYIRESNAIIEVDGDYYHSYGLVEEEMNPMQKHNKWVDKQKDKWAAERGIPVIRIWEHDINKNPEKVKQILKERLGEATRKQQIKNEKKKRH
jgi:very-short-patch-repair endonuclease